MTKGGDVVNGASLDFFSARNGDLVMWLTEVACLDRLPRPSVLRGQNRDEKGNNVDGAGQAICEKEFPTEVAPCRPTIFSTCRIPQKMLRHPNQSTIREGLPSESQIALRSSWQHQVRSSPMANSTTWRTGCRSCSELRVLNEATTLHSVWRTGPSSCRLPGVVTMRGCAIPRSVHA